MSENEDYVVIRAATFERLRLALIETGGDETELDAEALRVERGAFDREYDDLEPDEDGTDFRVKASTTATDVPTDWVRTECPVCGAVWSGLRGNTFTSSVGSRGMFGQRTVPTHSPPWDRYVVCRGTGALTSWEGVV